MAEREVDNRLEQLRSEGHTIYSISRLDSINNCAYGAYRTYHLNERGTGNVYSNLGGKIHDCLEGITNEVNTEEDLIVALHAELEDCDLMGYEFPKGRDGSDSIKQGWIDNMTHFCNHYKKPDGKYEAEQTIIYKTPKGNYLVGYIDLTKINDDGSLDIIDYKTSSMYSKESIKEHSHQLLLYAMARIQEGYKVNSISWQFLKYATIKFLGKKTVKSKEKTWLEKNVERRKIGAELEKYVVDDLYNLGYDEIDTELVINELKATNDIKCLPEAIRNNYIISECFVEYPITDENIEECNKYIDDTISYWESLDSTDENDFTHRAFIKTNKLGKKSDDYFFCVSLCDHAKKCPHLQDYLATKDNADDEEDDLF